MKNILMVIFILLTLPAISLPGYAMNKDLEAKITRILEENNTTAASIVLIEADGRKKISWG